MGFLDELQSGAPIVATPDLQAELGLSATAAATVIFTAPLLVCAVLDPALILLSARWDRRATVAGALVLMALTQVGIGFAGGALALSAAFALWMLATTLATSLAEVALVAGAPDASRAMNRWALAGSLGDLLAPLLFAACVGLGLSWRAALGFGAAIALINAARVLAGPPLMEDEEEDEDEDDEEAGGLRGLLSAARDPALRAWILAATACTLFDEVFVAFGSLWLRAHGASAATQGLAFACFSLGSAAGQLAVDRLLADTAPRRLLGLAAAAMVVLFPLWLTLPASLAAPAALLLGVGCAPMWALCSAQSYEAGRPSQVAALTSVFGVFDVALPLFLGLIADRFGLLPAMLCLLAQPIVVGLVSRRSEEGPQQQQPLG